MADLIGLGCLKGRVAIFQAALINRYVILVKIFKIKHRMRLGASVLSFLA